MKIRLGYRLTYNFFQPSTLLLAGLHQSRTVSAVIDESIRTSPSLPHDELSDSQMNRWYRIDSPAGRLHLAVESIVNDSGLAPAPPSYLTASTSLPNELQRFLDDSPCCEKGSLTRVAKQMFGAATPAVETVEDICGFVNRHLSLHGKEADARGSADTVGQQLAGRGRDHVHLAITFCRCLGIPARYCAGYLSTIGLQPPVPPADFAAWFEAWVDGAWRTFDPLNRMPRIGRILMTRGVDATDASPVTAYGAHIREDFKVCVQELQEDEELQASTFDCGLAA